MDKVMALYVQGINVIKSAQKGQGLVEYALILVLVAIVVIAGLTLLGGNINSFYSAIATRV